MKFSVLGWSAALWVPALVVSAEPFEEIDLAQCWGRDLTGQLLCMEHESNVCLKKVEEDAMSSGLQSYQCMYETFDQADAHLNVVYEAVIQHARQSDADPERNSRPSWTSAEEEVRNAQRKWIAYRDAQGRVYPSWQGISVGFDGVLSLDMAKLSIIQAHVLEASVPDDPY